MKFSSVVILSLLIFVSCKQISSRNLNNISNKSEDNGQVMENGLGKKIDSLLQLEMAIGFSGSVMIAIDDKVILRNGYGWTDSLKTVPISPQTKFYLASTTKGFTGVVALIAQENEVLSVFDPLSKFDLDCPEEFSPISINDMLIHTSGLSNEYATFGMVERNENMSLLYKLPLGPKGKFKYSGAGYWLTAAIIEKEAQVKYEEYVHEYLFDVAEMNSSNFWFESNEEDNSFAPKLKKFPPNDLQPNWGYRASGGITTNIIDLQKYLNSLISGKILNRESLNQLFGPHKTLNSGIGIGYGWYTTTTSRGTTEIWSRGGESFGHNSAIRWFKDENVMILILTNCGRIEGKDYEANKTVSDKIEKLIFEK